MKQIKLFMVMLLSLVGMTAAAQQPTLVSSTAKPVTSSTLTTGKYLIAAGTTDGSYYFNVNGTKVNVDAPLTQAQIFTYTIANCLRRNSDNYYVYVKNSNMSASSIYNPTTMTMDISFNSEDAASIQANGRYIVSNGDNASAASLSSTKSYNWYFYKAAVVNITYYDETNSKNIGKYTYVGRVGDQLQWPTISGYTLSSEATYSVKGGASVTVKYTNDAATIKLESGRYFMKNTITIDTDNAKNDVWMTSYKSLVSLIPDARSFWSVWVVTYDADKNTYKIYNEGNRNVMTPCTDPEQKELTRDDGYLYYDKKKKGYFVGSITEPGTQFTDLTVTNTSDGYMIRSSEAGAGYYLSIDNKWQDANDEGGYVLESDHCIKSISSGTDGTNPYWNFVEVTDDDDRMLYENGVQALNAYVGGLTTMNLPDADVVELQAAKEVVKKYEDDTEILKDNTTEAAVKYREFVEAINNMRSQTNTAVFCQHLVAGRPFWVETIGSRKGYLNRLTRNTNNTWTNVENSSVTEATPEGTFYATPVTDEATVIDPKTGVQTTYPKYYTLKNGKDYYLTSYTGNIYNNGYSIEGKDWSVWSQDENYKKGLLSSESVRAVSYTTTEADALQFVIIPIVPGIYQMCDIAPKWQGDPFLTFANNNGTDKIPQLHHYRVSESFSYFKFKTYNEYKYSVKNPLTTNSFAVGTYGELLNSKISSTDGIKAYYIRAGKHSYYADNTIKKRNAVSDPDPNKNEMADSDWGIYWDKDLASGGGNAGNNSVNPGVNDVRFTVYLDEVPTVVSGGDNVLQGMQGFVLKTTDNYGQKLPGKRVCEVYDGVIEKGSAQDLSDNNMLHAAINEIPISKDTWGNYYDIFVLAYKSTDEVVGYWHQQEVKGVGLGFYHLKRGQTLPTGRCYLSTADLCAQLKKRYPDTWDNTYFYPYPKTSTGGAAAPASDEGNQNEAGFRIVFRDSNGVQTAIEEAPIIEVDNEAELDAMSQIYSLDGRKVTTPKSGEIYILNGKKVMF